MVVLLNLFFDDYGLPSSYAWVFLAIALCIIDIIILAIYANGDDFLPLFTVLTSFALFFALYYPITSINPYNYIPISGTDTQKVNFKRCVVGKTVNLGNIKEIMQECKDNDREYAFQEKIEALGK
ncbi:TPA: hypothetical protein ACFU2Q_002053 [Neisseria subflava]